MFISAKRSASSKCLVHANWRFINSRETQFTQVSPDLATDRKQTCKQLEQELCGARQRGAAVRGKSPHIIVGDQENTGPRTVKQAGS
jgi:hypothetical protein